MSFNLLYKGHPHNTSRTRGWVGRLDCVTGPKNEWGGVHRCVTEKRVYFGFVSKGS